MEERGVPLSKGGVRFGYADKLDVRVRREVMQESLHVAVDQTHNSDPDVTGGLCGARSGKRAEEERSEERFEGETKTEGDDSKWR